MPFKYSCFISYRHCESDISERFITDFFNALSGEMKFYYTDKEVYLDRTRLQAGFKFNEALATALCESVCMIVVYTPIYFDKIHTYCAREYRAMMSLEEKRLSQLSNPEHKVKGLIIPVVLRGEDYMPREIKATYQYYKFDDFSLRSREMRRHKEYGPKIEEIAKYISKRCAAFASSTVDVFNDCSDFKLPSDSSIKNWLNKVMSSPQLFPLR